MYTLENGQKAIYMVDRLFNFLVFENLIQFHILLKINSGLKKKLVRIYR